MLSHLLPQKTPLNRTWPTGRWRTWPSRSYWHRSLQSLLTFLVIISILTSSIPALPTARSVSQRGGDWAEVLLDSAGGEVSFDRTRVTIPKDALAFSTLIRIEKLGAEVLPPLEVGMVNVTAGGGGYRFLPAGTVFAKPVTIEVPLPEAFVADEGTNIGGLYTYYWDETQSKWVQLTKVGVNRERKTLVSTTTHFTTMINGLLTAPDSPPPLQFNPNSIKDIAALNPAAGITLIQPPTANNQGSADLSYPIELLAGRGAYSPRLALSYSSARGNGWLGMGWDLPVSRIEIDTRWGVPFYEYTDSDTFPEPRERFLLDGAALVPIASQLAVSCKATPTSEVIRQYAPRNETFQRILFCIADGQTHWEVTAKDGTRFDYGMDAESRLGSDRQGEENRTGIWYLRRVVDPNGNITEYRYKKDPSDGETLPDGEPFVQKYLERIEYTSHLTPTLPAAYLVELTTDCSGRSDPIISGRLGFKVLTRCRLSQIDVSLNSSTDAKLIRSYTLDYKTGAFGKSLLEKVIARGANRSEFYEHTFEYTEPEYKTTTTPNQPFAATRNWPATAPKLPPDEHLLNHVTDTSHNVTQSGGFSFGFGVGNVSASCKLGGSTGVNLEAPMPAGRSGDISGDGIADRVWTNANTVSALVGTLGTNGAFTTSGADPLIPGLVNIGTEQSLGLSQNFGASCRAVAVSANAGISIVLRKSATTSLLTDVNGDGYPDLATGSSSSLRLASSCRDGQPPNASGFCSDGLRVCPATDPLCFGSALLSFTPTPDTPVLAATNLGQQSDPTNAATNLLVSVQTAGSLPLAESSAAAPLQQIDPITLEVEEDWGHHTAFGNRLALEPELKAEMHRMNPVIRWDAPHDGDITLKVEAWRKFLGGSDGVKVSVLRVTDATSSNGTQLLGELTLASTTVGTQTVSIPRPKLPLLNQVRFGDSFLVVVDTLDNVPIAKDGRPIDEIGLRMHIEYTTVCPPGWQLEVRCPPITQDKLAHKDATGQLAYVFDFPDDLRISELPRLNYWQLLPPIGPPQQREGELVHNRITGVVTKTAETDTPVHVRVRCESATSQQADDNPLCSLGRILKEHVFAADEIGEVDMSVDLPSPFRPSYRVAGTRSQEGRNRAYFGTPQGAGGTPQLVEIGTLGGQNSYAYAMNDDGAIAGASETAFGLIHAFLWTPDKGMVDLTPDLHGNSWAKAINNQEQVVGYLEPAVDDITDTANWCEKCTASIAAGQLCLGLKPKRAFLWSEKSKLIELGTLGGDSGEAYDINEQGQVVGASTIENGETHAFLWNDDNQNGQSDPGEMDDLRTLGGRDSQAFAVNDLGQVVGVSTVGTSTVATQTAFLWTPGGVGGTATNPEMVPLDRPDGTVHTKATDLNDQGQVVGMAWLNGDDAPTVPVLWTQGAIDQERNFDGLPNGATITGLHINRHGDIAGVVDYGHGARHSLLWLSNGERIDIGNGNAGIDGNVGLFGTVMLENSMAINGSYQYEPLRLLVEIDGENGAEVPPDAVEWQPTMEIVSVYDLKEAKRLDPTLTKTLGFAFESVTDPAREYYYTHLWSGEFGDTRLVDSDGHFSKPGGINSKGQIAGFTILDRGTHAFIWSPTSADADPATAQPYDLKTLGADYPSSEAHDINDQGQVVGFSTTASGQAHAFLWTPGGKMLKLGTLGGNDSRAWAINNRGQVAGESSLISGTVHAVLWTPDQKMIDLETLGGSTSRAWAINDLGQVVGESTTKDGDLHAFLWNDENQNGQSDPGDMRDLGTLGNSDSMAYGINNRGEVVGASFVTDGPPHAFLWTPNASACVPRMYDLDDSNPDMSFAHDINEQGQIAGTRFAENETSNAALWSPGDNPVLFDSAPASAHSQAIGVTGGSVLDFARRDRLIVIDPEAPWQEQLPALYRVHPARQLTPLRTMSDGQTLEVTATVVKPRNPLIVTVIGEDGGELTREVVNPADAGGKPAVTRRFRIQLPEAGLYYVRGYSEAAFDPQVSMHLSARLLDVPQTALVNKNKASQIGGVQQYADLNRADARIVVVAGSAGEYAARQRFPKATIELWNDSLDAVLEGALLTNEAVALIGDAKPLWELSQRSDVSPVAYLCCAANLPQPLVPKLPTNLLMADFGGRYERGKAFTLTMPGEVWYSFETFGGGHHGFFYGQFNGDEKLECIGLFPCQDQVQPSASSEPAGTASVFASGGVAGAGPSELITSPSGAHRVGLAAPIWPILSIGLAAPVTQNHYDGYLALVRKRQPGEIPIETYDDINQPGVVLWLPMNDVVLELARTRFPLAQIQQFQSDNLDNAVIQSMVNDGDALLFNASALQQLLADNPSWLEYVYLCCTRDTLVQLYSCHVDSNSDGSPDCEDPTCQVDSDGDGIVDCRELNCDLDSDDDTITDCLDWKCSIDSDGDHIPNCKEKEEHTDCFCEAGGAVNCQDPACQIDSDGDGFADCCDENPQEPVQPIAKDIEVDGTPNAQDLCPYSPEDKDNDRDGDGCPDDPPHPSAPEASFNNGMEDEERAVERGGPMDPPAPGEGGGGTDCYHGPDSSLYICGDGSTHATRKGVGAGADASLDIFGLERTWTLGIDTHIGAGVDLGESSVPVGLGATGTIGGASVWTDSAYMDWNGDGIPDQISPDVIVLGGSGQRIPLHQDCRWKVGDKCLAPAIRERLNLMGALSFSLSPTSTPVDSKTNSNGKTRSQGAPPASFSFGVNSHLSQSTAWADRMDINGDGLPDVVMARLRDESNDVDLIVRLNLGYRLGNEENWGTIAAEPDEDRGVLADTTIQTFGPLQNDNGLYTNENLSTGNTTGVGLSAQFALWGGGFKFSNSESVTLVQTRRLLADVNGDGLPDLILKNPGSNSPIHVHFNRGSAPAFETSDPFASPPWQKVPQLPISDVSLANVVTTPWLTQIWFDNPDPMNLSYSKNRTMAGEVEVTAFGVNGTTSYAYSSGSNSSELGFFDVNGDGLPDRVLRTDEQTDGGIQVQENLFGGANLLKTVHRPLGGRIDLTYRQQKPSEHDPNARWLLQTATLANEEAFPTAYVTAPISQTFDYADPYYDRLEREFNGFRTVRSTLGDGRMIETTYANRDYWLRGVVTDTRTLGSDGKLYIEAEYNYQPERTHDAQPACLNQLTGSLSLLGNATARAAGITPCDTWFVKPMTVVTRRFEGKTPEEETPAKVTTLHYQTYDDYGNVTQIKDDQDEGPDDDLVALVVYDHVDRTDFQQAHIVDRVRSVDVRQGSASGTQLRFRRATYDAQGNLEQHEIFADAAGTKIDRLVLETDDTGFVTSITDASLYRVTYTPDPLTHRVALTTTDSFSLTATAEYDFGLQLPTKQVDVNGQVMENHYDVYGRLDRVQGPYELAAGLNTNSLSVTYGQPGSWATAPVHATTTNLAVVPVSNTVSTEIRTAIFVDGLGRTIQTQTDAEVNGASGRVVSGKVEFDTAGRVSRMGQPSFVAGSTIAIENTAFVTNTFTQWEYDPLDRAVTITAPGNRITRLVYDLDKHPRQPRVITLRTQITDPENKVRYEHRDAMEQLVAVVQIADGANLVTSYEYQPTGELAAIVDARNSKSQLEYDLAGRRTAVTTPDTGRLELGYDAAGNLVEKTDAELCQIGGIDLLTHCANQKIRYEYDKSRLKSIHYPTLPETKFIYGDKAAPGQCTTNQANTRGRICRVEDASGVELRSYGALGETVQTERTMQGAAWETAERTFTTKYVFDSFGRMLSMVYPDGEQLAYGYDTGGRVNQVTGIQGSQTITYVRDIQYDEFGQRTRLEYGNGVVTTQTYEPETRRLDIQTITEAGAANPLRQLDYGYDRADNILSVTDVRADVAPFLRGASRTYTYDDLHRLKSFTLTAEPASSAATTTATVLASYDYDSVGNLMSQTVTHQGGAIPVAAYVPRAWTYAYDNPERPNLPDKIGPYTFAYDDRGSLESFTRNAASDAPLGATYTWDDEGRLRTSQRQGGGTMTAYTYSQDGQRARKQTPATLANPTDPSDATVYPNEFYTARFARTDGATCEMPTCWEQEISRSKHVYVEKERIAVTAAVVVSATASGPETGLNTLPKVTHFFHSDQVGSTALTTNESGQVRQQIDYLPFGEVLFDQQASDRASLPQALRFDGKELDSETGLQYFGARYYDPRFGRFASADSLFKVYPDAGNQVPRSLNLFAFGLNNPIRYRDPNGLDNEDKVWGVVRALGGIGEAAAGVALGVSTSWTGIGAVAGAAVAVHGIDVAIAGFRQAFSGEQKSSGTSQLLQATGVSRPNAELIDTGISVVGSLGAGIATALTKVAAVRATDPLAKGLSTRQILSRIDKGSQALNKADYKALGGEATSSLAKAQMIEKGVDAANQSYQLTTGFGVRIAKSITLLGTGPTPSGNIGIGVIGAGLNAATLPRRLEEQSSE